MSLRLTCCSVDFTSSHPADNRDRAPLPGPPLSQVVIRIVFLHVATWNINCRGPKVCHSLGPLAHERGVDVVLLQEANPNSLEQFVSAAGLDWVITAFTAGAPYRAQPDAAGLRPSPVEGEHQTSLES